MDLLNQTKTQTLLRSCRCLRSNCKKLLCECFAVGQACNSSCQCIACFNSVETYRLQPILKQPQIHSELLMNRKIACTCRKSQCALKYCDCFNNGQFCNSECKCEGCKNGKPKEEENSPTSIVDNAALCLIFGDSPSENIQPALIVMQDHRPVQNGKQKIELQTNRMKQLAQRNQYEVIIPLFKQFRKERFRRAKKQSQHILKNWPALPEQGSFR